MPLDNRTLMTVAMLVALGLGVVGAIVSRSESAVRSAGRWAAANLLVTVGLLLFAMRGIWPDPLTVAVANAFAIGSAALYLEVVRELCALPGDPWPPYGVGALAFAALCYFEFRVDDIQARVMILSLYVGIICMACAVTLFSHLPERSQLGYRVTGLVFAVYSLSHFIRAIASFAERPHGSLFAPTAVNTGFFVINVLSVLGWSVGFLLVTNERMMEDLRRAHGSTLAANAALEGALGRVRLLSGLLPICATCKRIRDERGSWEPIERYVGSRSEAAFTHGVCPECAERARSEYHRASDPLPR